MNKRGQVSTFVIIGIILIVLISLFLFLRDRIYIGPSSEASLQDEFPPIEEHIQECLTEKGEQRMRELAIQGGYLDPGPDTYLEYLDNKVAYRCFNVVDQPYCSARILTVDDMEEQLELKVGEDLRTDCLDLDAFDKIGYDMELVSGNIIRNLNQGLQNLKIEVEIGEDTTEFTAILPIRISKDDTFVERDRFTANVDLPLGRLYDVSHNFVNQEATSGFTDTLLFNIAKTQTTNKPYICQKLQPYPDKIYICKIKDVPNPDNEFIFQFAIQDEPRRGL